MVGVGIWILLERNYASAIFGSHLMTAAAYIIIVGGGLVIIISFCGCVGAVQEIPCLLMTVSSCLFYESHVVDSLSN